MSVTGMMIVVMRQMKLLDVLNQYVHPASLCVTAVRVYRSGKVKPVLFTPSQDMMICKRLRIEVQQHQKPCERRCEMQVTIQSSFPLFCVILTN